MRLAPALTLAAAVLAGTVAASATPEPVSRVVTGAGPCGAASGFGSVWVAVYGTGRLVRIDPRSNRVVARIRIARGICPIVVAAGSVWVASDMTNMLYRIDPRRRRIVARIPVADWPAHVTAAFGVSGCRRTNAGRSRGSTRAGTGCRVSTPSEEIPPASRRRRRALDRIRAERFVAWSAGSEERSADEIVDRSQRARLSLGHRRLTVDDDRRRVRGPLRSVREAGRRSLRHPGDPGRGRGGPRRNGLGGGEAAQHLTRIDPDRNRIVDVTGAGPGALAIASAGATCGSRASPGGTSGAFGTSQTRARDSPWNVSVRAGHDVTLRHHVRHQDVGRRDVWRERATSVCTRGRSRPLAA